MRLKKTWAVTKRTFRQIRHDKRTLSMIIFFPLIAMLLFIGAFAGEPKHIKAIVVDRDETSFTQTIASDLNKELLDVEYKEDLDEARSALTNGEVRAVIFFERGFTRDIVLIYDSIIKEISANKTLPKDIAPPRAYLMADNSDVQIAKTVAAEVNGAIQEAMKKKYGIGWPISVQEELIYSKNLRFIDCYLPGVLGLVSMMMSFVLTILLIVRERTNGTLERLLVVVDPSDVILGYICAFSLINIFQVSLLLFSAWVLFDIFVAGSLLLVFLILFLLSMGFQGLGVLVSTVAKSELEAVQFIPVVMYVSLVLSNVFWPLESVVVNIRFLSYFVPLAYAVDALKDVMVRGWDLTRFAVSIDVTVLVVFSLLTTWLSIRALGKK